VFFGQIVDAAAGYSIRELLIDKLGLRTAWASTTSAPPRPQSVTLRAAACLCFLLIAAILWHLKGPTIGSVSNILIAAFLILASFTCFTSIFSLPFGRYAFLPGVTFLLLLLIQTGSVRKSVVPYVSMLILSYGLATGIINYKSRRSQVGPPWSTEVQSWRANHSHLLRVWPTGWKPYGGIAYNRQ